jgi:hypothetical protein
MNTVYTKVNNYRYDIHVNTVYIGSFEIDVDGYFNYYDDRNNGGFIPSWLLLELGNKLVELNYEWDKEIQEALFNHQPDMSGLDGIV